MFRIFFCLAIGFLLSGFLLSGCGGSSTTSAATGGVISGSSGGGTPPPTTTSVSGVVTSSVEGPPVSGANISALQSSTQAATGLSTTSSATGSFTLTGVASGTYDLLATKTGFAAARYQALAVGTTPVTGISLPLFPQNGIGTPGSTPVITLGAGTPQPNGSVTGNQTFTINVSESGGNPNAISDIILRVGGNSVGSVQNAGTLTQSVNFSQYPGGAVTVTIVASDVAHDTTTMSYTVNNGGASGTMPNTTFTVTPLAQTFGQDLQVLLHNRQVLWSKRHLQGNPNLLAVPNQHGVRVIDLGKLSGARPSSTSPSTSIAVQVTINYTGGNYPAGYNIYRATTPFGPFTLLGSVPSSNCKLPSGTNPSCVDATFNDFDPSLTPGMSYYYKAAAYTGSAVGLQSPSSPPAVTILDAFHVNLVSPGGPPSSTAATTPNTSTSPTLVWQAASAVGTEQVYDPFVFSQTNNYTSTFLCGGNTLFSSSTTPILTVSGGQVKSGPSGVTVSQGGTQISFPYSAFSGSGVKQPCSVPLQAGVIYEWDLAESVAEGSENPPGSGNFMAISVGNGEAYQGGQSLASGSDNGAFFFTTMP